MNIISKYEDLLDGEIINLLKPLIEKEKILLLSIPEVRLMAINVIEELIVPDFNRRVAASPAIDAIAALQYGIISNENLVTIEPFDRFKFKNWMELRAAADLSSAKEKEAWLEISHEISDGTCVLFKRHQGLIWRESHRISKLCDQDAQDLFSIGIIAMQFAIPRFDKTKSSFSHYLVGWVRSLQQKESFKSNQINLPEKGRELLKMANHEMDLYQQEHGKPAKPWELAEILNVEERSIDSLNIHQMSLNIDSKSAEKRLMKEVDSAHNMEWITDMDSPFLISRIFEKLNSLELEAIHMLRLRIPHDFKPLSHYTSLSIPDAANRMKETLAKELIEGQSTKIIKI